jgi:hypothetical protein
MKPKEKALKLFNKFYFRMPSEMDDKIKTLNSKLFALIAVDEIIDSIDIGFEDYKSLKKSNYWMEVKQEIEL